MLIKIHGTFRMGKSIETIGSINLLYVVALSKMNTVYIVLSRKSNIVSQAKTETTRLLWVKFLYNGRVFSLQDDNLIVDYKHSLPSILGILTYLLMTIVTMTTINKCRIMKTLLTAEKTTQSVMPQRSSY